MKAPPLARTTGFSELPLLLALLLYFSLSLYQLSLPGLHYDEAQEVIPAIQLVLGQPTEPLRGAALHLAGRDLPLMIQNYIGALNTYLALPTFTLLGVNVFSLRLMTVLLGAITLILGFRVAQSLFDAGVASLTALFLAVNPSFIFWTRQGAYVTSVLTVLSMASLFSLLQWHQNRRPIYLYLGSLFLGLGLWAKLSFLWFLGGLSITAIFFSLYSARRGLTTLIPSPRQLCFAALFFLLGASPLVVYNLQTQGSFQEILRYLDTSYYGIRNLAFFFNLGARLGNFNSLLDGGHFWYLGATPQNFLSPPLFWLLALSVIPLLILKVRGWPSLVFLVALLASMVPLSTFTISDFKPTHYLLFLPLPQIFIAAGLVAWSHRNQTLRLLALLLALALIGWDLKSDLEYHRALARTGGYPDHSAAIYDLADYLAAHADRPVVAMDWGFRNSIYFLTQGRVDPDEIFGYESFTEPDPGFAERLDWYLAQPETLYLFHTRQWTLFQREKQFRALAQEADKNVDLVKTFYDRSGMEVFVLVRVSSKD